MADLNELRPPRPRDVQEPLLTSDELSALMKAELPESLPQGFASGVNEFFSLLERVADGKPTASAQPMRPTPAPAAATKPPDPPAPPVPAETDPAPAAEAPVAAPAPSGASEPPALANLPILSELAPPERNRTVAALVEIGLLYALVVGIELAWTGHIGSFGTHPHPYWLVVLPMAAARGLWSGLAAAILGGTFVLIGAVQALRIDDPRLLFDYHLLLEPILFGFAAFFVGQFRDDLLLRYRKLWRVLEHTAEDAARLAEANAQLTERNRDYQLKLLDHSTQFGNLIDVARRLELADEREILELALDMVKEHCGATRCSVLMVVAVGVDDAPDHLELVAERGWPEPTIRLGLQAAARSPLARKCVREAVPVSGFEPAMPLPKDGPLLVAPIFDQSTVLWALLCLEEMPADRYSVNLEAVFNGVAEWTTVSLARVRAGRRAQEFTPKKATEVAEVWLGTATELGERLRLEDARCTHQGVTTSLIALHAAALKTVDASTLAEFDARVRDLATGALRASDTLYRFGYPGCWIAVLPDTPLHGAKVVCQRLARRLRMTASGVLGDVSIEAYAPDDDHPSLPSLLARLTDAFRNKSSVPLDARCPVQVPVHADIGDAVAFVRAVRIELELAMRGDYELFVVAMWLDVEDRRQRDLFAQHMEQQHGRLLRATDGMYRLSDDHFAMLLPDAAGVVAFTLVGDLLELLGGRLSDDVVAAVRHEVFVLTGAPGEAQRLIDRLVEQTQNLPAVPEPLAPVAPDDLPSSGPVSAEQAALAKIFGVEPVAPDADEIDALADALVREMDRAPIEPAADAELGDFAAGLDAAERAQLAAALGDEGSPASGHELTTSDGEGEHDRPDLRDVRDGDEDDAADTPDTSGSGAATPARRGKRARSGLRRRRSLGRRLRRWRR
ncbi:MAG: GAF domain-containing protein [Planctomycetota bacterium]